MKIGKAGDIHIGTTCTIGAGIHALYFGTTVNPTMYRYILPVRGLRKHRGYPVPATEL